MSRSSAQRRVHLGEQFAKEMLRVLQLTTKLPNLDIDYEEEKTGIYFFIRLREHKSPPLRFISIDTTSNIPRRKDPDPAVYVYVWGNFSKAFRRDRYLPTLFEGKILSYSDIAEVVERILAVLLESLDPEYLKSPLEILTEDYSEDE